MTDGLTEHEFTLLYEQRYVRYWADLSEREIAHALGISTGSVKTHVHRAMTTLATVLVEERR